MRAALWAAAVLAMGCVPPAARRAESLPVKPIDVELCKRGAAVCVAHLQEVLAAELEAARKCEDVTELPGPAVFYAVDSNGQLLVATRAEYELTGPLVALSMYRVFLDGRVEVVAPEGAGQLSADMSQ